MFGFVISDLTPKTHFTMIIVWFSNQWFVFNKHTWIWFLSSFVISVLTSKRALENDYCFVLQSVIWPQTHTWRWFLSGFGISYLSSNHTLNNDSCLVCNQFFLLKNHALDNDSCLVLQSVIWPQKQPWRCRWFLSGFGISDLSSINTLGYDSCLVLESVNCLQNTYLTMIVLWFVISFFT